MEKQINFSKCKSRGQNIKLIDRVNKDAEYKLLLGAETS